MWRTAGQTKFIALLTTGLVGVLAFGMAGMRDTWQAEQSDLHLQWLRPHFVGFLRSSAKDKLERLRRRELALQLSR